MSALPKIVYCSWSPFKKEEWEAVRHSHELPSSRGRPLDSLVDFEFRKVPTSEPLKRDLAEMVRHKAISAYEAVRVPCVVEHAGLVLEAYGEKSYPGGLTQPMWDALGAEKFIEACAPLGRKVIARAVIGYCDGLIVKTFTGEMSGSLSDAPRGERAFYWDTVFCPDGFDGRTYAEIAGDPNLGLPAKMSVSQSIKALKQMIEYQIVNRPALFPGL